MDMSGEYKRYYWLKLPEDFFNDDTIDFIESQENGEKYVVFYLKLCLKALKNEGKLIRYVGNLLLPYDESGISKLTNTDIDTVRSALILFSQIGLIQRLETGEIYLTQINEMVGTETEKAKYMRQKRLKQKGNNEVTMLPEKGNIVPKCNLEIEIDKEKEIDNKSKQVALLQREPKNEIETIEKIYLQNYTDLFNNGFLKLEKPVINWTSSRKLTKNCIAKYGLQTICEAVRKSKDNKFVVSKGYVLTTILSAGVLSQLINATDGRIDNDSQIGEIDF